MRLHFYLFNILNDDNHWYKLSIPIDTMGHEVVEVFVGHKSVVVEVGLGEHVLDLVVGQILTQILSYFFQIVDCELSLRLLNEVLIGWGRRR